MVMLTDAKLRFLHPNGGSEVVEAHAGQLLEVPLGVHLPENLLDTPFEAVGVEFMYQTKPLSRSARGLN
jgi:hypothetical protein